MKLIDSKTEMETEPKELKQESAEIEDFECPDSSECLEERPCRQRPLNFFPLCTANSGDIVKVVRVTDGRGAKSKLAAMGIYPGAVIEAIGNLGGPMILKVKDSRLSIGRGLAAKIMVEK